MHKAESWHRVVACLLALAAAAPAGAQEVPVALYPLVGQGRGVLGPDLASLQGLLESSLHLAIRRGAQLVPRAPLTVRSECGTEASAGCLARLSRGGVVVSGSVRLAGPTHIFSLEMVDSAGRLFGPVSVGVDSYLQNPDPLARVLLTLSRQALAGPPPVPPPPVAGTVPAPALPPATEWRERPAPGAPAAAPPSSWREGPAATVEAKPRAASWRGKVGPWATGAGLGLLGTGVYFGLAGKTLSKKLDDRYRANQLTSADAATYTRVDTYATVANVLFVAGGLTAATGVYLWATAPSASPRDGLALHIAGSF